MSITFNHGKSKALKMLLLRCLDVDFDDLQKKLGKKITPKYEKLRDSINVEWDNLPQFEYLTEKFYLIEIKYGDDKDRKTIEGLLGIPLKGKSPWFPVRPIDHYGHFWITETPQNPQYPVYIISKGRWNERITQQHLEKMGVPYKLVVETQEYKKYREFVDESKLLKLPKERCNLGQGSIPVRNFVWEHSMANGFSHHWVLDDNIDGFHRFNKNARIPVKSGVCFKVIEDYVNRYENIVLAGLNYSFFCPEISKRRLLCQTNTRIYSCILIDNKLDVKCGLKDRWRGKYNEDTDLSLRVLKKGFPTALFNCFLANKMGTLRCKGGNTDSIYKDDGLEKKIDSLIEQHPDVVKKTMTKYKRGVHHQVDYRPYSENKAIAKKGLSIPKGVNNYGMILVKKVEKEEKEADVDLEAYASSSEESVESEKPKDTEYIIVIPSYDRHKKLKETTLEYLKRQNINLEKVYVFVANEDELKKYKKHINIPSLNFVVGEKGIVKQSKCIEDHFPKGKRIFRLDDDISSVWERPRLNTEYKPEKLKKDFPNSITRKELCETIEIDLDLFIKTGFSKLDDLGLNMFGVNKVQKPVLYDRRYFHRP